MITTFQEIIKKEGFEPLKKYNFDKWIGGIDRQYHITSILFVDEGAACIWFNEFYERTWSDDLETSVETKRHIIKYDTDIPFIWADNIEEANIDLAYLKEKDEAEENHKVNKCLSFLKQFCDAYAKLSLESGKKVDSAIKDVKDDRFMIVRSYIWRWQDRSEEIGEDEMYEIQRIYSSHTLDFADPENDEIRTKVNLDNARSIYRCKHDGKMCVCIEMSDEKEYYVYQKKNSTEYLALCVLYYGGCF